FPDSSIRDDILKSPLSIGEGVGGEVVECLKHFLNLPPSTPSFAIRHGEGESAAAAGWGYFKKL
ncbi:MAG: hypothetical protein R2942_12320, partial [Ignavibacteria bacterium]